MAQQGTVKWFSQDKGCMASAGTPDRTGHQAQISPRGVGGPNVTGMALEVPAEALPGIYKVRRAWAETYGGHLYRFEREELGTMVEIGFEVVEEPDEKPEVLISLEYVGPAYF